MLVCYAKIFLESLKSIGHNMSKLTKSAIRYLIIEIAFEYLFIRK